MQQSMAFWIMVGLMPLLSYQFYGWIVKKYRIRRWKQALNLDQHFHVFNDLFTEEEGFFLSRQARSEHDAFAYTYGEIEFFSFIALMFLAKPGPETRYYDLGSGIGKAAIACAMVFEMEKYCGIELFRELYDAAQDKKGRLAQLVDYTAEAQRVAFIHDDFFNVDLSDATLIFINATAFVGELWERLSLKLAQEAKGAIIITTSKALCSEQFIVEKTTKVNMSWGVVNAYIHCQQTLMTTYQENSSLLTTQGTRV